MAATHCLALIEPLDPATGLRVPVRVASAQLRQITGLGGSKWAVAMTAPPRLTWQLFDGDFSSPISVGNADITINLAALQATSEFADTKALFWQGAPITIYVGKAGDTWPWRAVFTGEVGNINARGRNLTLSAAVNGEAFEREILTATYAGTGGAEGDENIKGQVKPLALGWPQNVRPVLINAVDSIYQFSAYGPIEAVTALYERGSAFGAPVANYATYAALQAATIAPGQWATCLAEGLIRLGAPEYGVITGDIRGHAVAGTAPRRTGAIISLLGTLAGVDAGRIASGSLTALDAGTTMNVSEVLTAQATFLETARRLVLPCNYQSGIWLDGRFFVAKPDLSQSEVLSLHAQGKRMPQVAEAQEESVRRPYYRITFGAQRSWYVHGPSEIAATLLDASDVAYGDGTPIEDLKPADPNSTRNDDGLNMLPNSGDPATWTFANGAYAALQNTGYAGMPNGWYASLLSTNALVRFSDYVPVAGGETLYFSYTVASDHPVGAAVGQTVNASYSYKRADGSSAAVNLGGSPYNSSRDIAQMGSGIVVTVKFTVPIDAVSIQPYVERPVFTSYTVFVRAGAYLGRGEPGATANVVTYSATAPSAPREGDLWVDTSGTYAVFKLRSGGGWVTGANALAAYNSLSGRPIALADINTTESSKLTGIADKATRNDDGPNMLPTAGDQATWSFGGGAVPVNVTTGYAGMVNDWYAQLQSSGASVRFSDYIPCSPGETLHFSYIVASDYPVGAPSGQTVNASYAYMRPDGSTAAVNLSSVSARDLAQMGGGTLVTARFTVPLDAVKVQPYVERPTFAGYTAYVRRNAYLGRSAPGATNNSATINDDGTIKNGLVGTGALMASAVTTKSSAYTGGGIVITPGGYVFVIVQQLTLTSTGEPVHLIFSHAYYAIDNAKVKVQVWRDGTLLLTLNERNVSGGDNGGECMVFTDTPGAGTFTYYVKVGSNDNGDTTVYNRSIFALELKR